MGFLTLEDVPSGTRIFIDAPIFIYHFTACSESCRRFLERCETGELDGLTSTVVLAEVTHRLMMIEAVSKGLLSPGNVAKKLRNRPNVARELDVYQRQVEKIPLMAVKVVPFDLKLFLRSTALRREHGLLVNDSLVAAAALEQNAPAIASGDRDFERVDTLELFLPADL